MSKAATSRVNAEIATSEPVDVDNQVIGGAKGSSMSIFEKMLEEEMRKGDAVLREKETERKCPFCNDYIPVKHFFDHKKDCKDREAPKREVFKVAILEKDLQKEAEKAKKNAKPYKKKASVWRRQHEEFVGSVGNGNTKERSDEPPEDDRIQCEFCGRRFAEETHKRHVKSCGEKAAKNRMKDRAASGTKPTNQSISSASSTGLPRKNSTSSASSTTRQPVLSATRSTKPTISSGRRY